MAGPSIHDNVARTKFGDIEFPCESHVIHNEGRKHAHEYWKFPGAAQEKGGRGSWDVTLKANFQTNFRAYPNLYPDKMNSLRADFESQVTRTFVHPTFGTFPAWIYGWEQRRDPHIRS